MGALQSQKDKIPMLTKDCQEKLPLRIKNIGPSLT
jgi:septation ring formation regulator EzrA